MEVLALVSAHQGVSSFEKMSLEFCLPIFLVPLCINNTKHFFYFFLRSGTQFFFAPKIDPPPLKAKKKYSQLQALLYSKRPALEHRSNEAIGKLIRVRGAEISSEKCQILTVWFGYLTHVSEDISALHTRINLPIALLERCCQASRLEYNKAYI